MTGYQRQSKLCSENATSQVALNWMNHYLGPGEQQNNQQETTNNQSSDKPGQKQGQKQIPRNWQEYKSPFRNWQEYKAMTHLQSSENSRKDSTHPNGKQFQPDDSQIDAIFPLEKIKMEVDEDIYCVHDTFRYNISICLKDTRMGLSV